MPSSNAIRNIALVGATGNIGSSILSALHSTNNFTITALVRTDSPSPHPLLLPPTITTKHISYTSQPSLVSALTNQDCLIITLSGLTPPTTQNLLIAAAVEANVPWILPNEWSPADDNPVLADDIFVFKPKLEIRRLIAATGKSSYIAVCTGFWYEWNLANPVAFGIDLVNKKATLFDEGEAKISTSTLPHVGKAVAGLLSLPITSQNQGEACLEDYRNKVVFVKSFTVSQKAMLASAIRVTGTKEEEWTIEKQGARERFEEGKREIGEGNMRGYSKLVARLFWGDGVGVFDWRFGVLDGVLGLKGEGEDLDGRTRMAVARAEG